MCIKVYIYIVFGRVFGCDGCFSWPEVYTLSSFDGRRFCLCGRVYMCVIVCVCEREEEDRDGKEMSW